MKVNQNILQQQNALSMNTLTELHVPHHHHHQHHHHTQIHHEIFLSPEQQQHQQLVQINNMLQKHENPIQDQMLLYQVNQNGQIMELNQIHQQSPAQQNHTMTNRLYKNDLIELDASVPLPAMHGIQTPLNSAMNEDLAIVGESRNNFSRNIETHLTSSNVEQMPSHVKKRKGEGGNGKSFFKVECKKSYTAKNKKKHLVHHSNTETTDESTALDDTNCDAKNHHENANDKKNVNNFATASSSSSASNIVTAATDNSMSKGNESGSDGSQIQCIRFSLFQQQQWHTLLDHNHQEL